MDVNAIPRKYRQLYRRAMTGKSRKAAIRAHCVMCMGWQGGLVDGCTAPDCPLYPNRNGDAAQNSCGLALNRGVAPQN